MVRAIKWIVDSIGADEFRETIQDFIPERDEGDEWRGEMALPIAVHWLLGGKRDKDGHTLGDRWREAGWPNLNNDERVMSEHRCRSFPTLIEIQRVDGTEKVWVNDLWAAKGSESFLIIDRTAAKGLNPYDLLVGWVTRYPHFGRFVGTVIQVPRNLREAFESEWRVFAKENLGLKHRASLKDMRLSLASDFDYAYDLVGELRHSWAVAMMRGADLQICRTYYHANGARESILQQLSSLPEFEKDDHAEHDDLPASIAFTWLRRGESKRIEADMPESFRHPDESAGVGVLGRLCVGMAEVMVQTMNPQLNAFARLRLDEIFGRELSFVRESRIDAAAQMAELLEQQQAEQWDPSEAEAPPLAPISLPDAISSEVRAQLVLREMERHFDSMADARIPIFGNRTPREAAANPSTRSSVVDWMKDQWQGTIEMGKRNGADLSHLPRKLALELGLHELFNNRRNDQDISL
jgi:hypothetical protein